MIIATVAAPPCFPAVHPLTVVIELADNELRRLRVKHTAAFGKKIITAGYNLRSQARLCEVDPLFGKFGSCVSHFSFPGQQLYAKDAPPVHCVV